MAIFITIFSSVQIDSHLRFTLIVDQSNIILHKEEI
jgi:hypothetical protein